MIETMAKMSSVHKISAQLSELRGSTTERFINSMREFHLDLDIRVTFESWFKRYKYVF